MYWKTRMHLKDATSISLVASSAAFLLRKAMKSDGALIRAGRNAAITGSAASTVAGGIGFVRSKTDHKFGVDESLEVTATHAAVYGGAAAIAAGVASLVWDALTS